MCRTPTYGRSRPESDGACRGELSCDAIPVPVPLPLQNLATSESSGCRGDPWLSPTSTFRYSPRRTRRLPAQGAAQDETGMPVSAPTASSSRIAGLQPERLAGGVGRQKPSVADPMKGAIAGVNPSDCRAAQRLSATAWPHSIPRWTAPPGSEPRTAIDASRRIVKGPACAE